MQTNWWGWGSLSRLLDINSMPKFLPYLKTLTGCNTDKYQGPVPFEDIFLNDPTYIPHMLEELSTVFEPSQLMQDKLTRILHAYGKSFRDLVRMRKGEISRAPDLVVFPKTEAQVLFLMQTAIKYNLCLIPFGGGTNIVGAVEIDPGEKRMVISVDLCYMQKVLHIDTVSQVATIQVGVLGPDLEAQLNEKGYTLGHFPDSFEYSSLGGWLATRSVGMQSDLYGPISDMLLSLHCVTPQGILITNAHPHASQGLAFNEIILGSEGRFGIITEATMKVSPLPEKQQFGVVLFPTLNAGVEAIKNCQMQKVAPAMMRLIDAEELKLSTSLSPEAKGISKAIKILIKHILVHLKKIDFDKCCLCILNFAGTAKEVKAQRQKVLSLCREQKGIYLGQQDGKRWYGRKYEYPQLRDIVIGYNCVVDVAETSTLWADVESLYNAVKKNAYTAMAECIPHEVSNTLERPGYLGCHLSHHYQNGTCLYFTFGFLAEPENMLIHYNKVKQAITNTIVAEKGALSHHHSIGYEHSQWLPEIIGETGIKLLKDIKSVLDPSLNLMGRDTI